MNGPRTIRDAYGELPASNLPERGARVCALMFDGTPLGNHPEETSGNRFGEKESLAMVLVSCEVDSEIQSIRTLEARPNTNTPDFEARQVNGSIVRIEMTRFADELIAEYMGNMNALFNIVQAVRRDNATLAAHIEGLHVLFDFDEAPRALFRHAVADEMVQLLLGIQRESATVFEVLEPPPECHQLRRLGVTWAVMAVDQPETYVRFQPPLDLADHRRMVSTAPTVLESKKRRYQQYSDSGSVPVWLAVFVADTISGSGLTAIQTLAGDVSQLDPAPFQRIVIGNFVAGIIIDSERSEYCSVSSGRVAIKRSE